MIIPDNTKKTKIFNEEIRRIYDKEYISLIEKYATLFIAVAKEQDKDVIKEGVSMYLCYIVNDLKEKWINDIADWLEVNEKSVNCKFFIDAMYQYLPLDKTKFKKQLKYYREHGELPMPKEIKFKK